jgi:2-polyprenyl-3-methyl-5-hydroxy-6-metoxy-1,4-benzoquinol methylase
MMIDKITRLSIFFNETLKSHFRFFRPDPNKYSTTDNLTIIPVQREAYFLTLNTYLDVGETVLDVGFGLGYGLTILSIKASSVTGIDVDRKCVDYCTGALYGRNPKLHSLILYDGKTIPFEHDHFDIVTCIDVIEHVEDYEKFLSELIRVSRKGVFISTPNRRPEYTNKDGTPKNYWHLREWNYDELLKILEKSGNLDWNFINGTWEGPFDISGKPMENTQALAVFIKKRIM